MKLILLTVLLMSVASSGSVAQSERSPQTSGKDVDAKTTREILETEHQLGVAIRAQDLDLLDRILADYYADAEDGSERAVSKRGAMARCKAGTLVFLALGDRPKFSRSAEIVTIEGRSKIKATHANEEEAREEGEHVRRLWTKKEGRWLLVAQFRRPIADGSSENKIESTPAAKISR